MKETHFSNKSYIFKLASRSKKKKTKNKQSAHKRPISTKKKIQKIQLANINN